MARSKTTKRALVASVCATLMCIAMLIGTTFAWFTDTASTSVNKIQSGTLDVELWQATSDAKLDSSALKWVKATDHESEEVLWEPGATYNLESFRIKNNGNLALKYKVIISGIIGDAKLLDAIDFTVQVGNGTATTLANWDGKLTAGAVTDAITITGTMKTTAGNEYQDLAIDGIAITVVATQDTVEYDSSSNEYDATAQYPVHTVADVQTTVEGDTTKVASAVTINSTEKTTVDGTEVSVATATIPANVVLNTGTTQVTLVVEDSKDTNNIQITSQQAKKTLEVKLEGVSASNTVPATVSYYIEKGLTGLELYHNTIEMTAVTSENDLAGANDNSYYYNSGTGKVTMKVATFSPFTYVYDNVPGIITVTANTIPSSFKANTTYYFKAGDYGDQHFVIYEAENVTLIGNSGAKFNSLQISSIDYADADKGQKVDLDNSTLTVKGFEVAENLMILESDKNVVVEDNTAAQITVKTNLSNQSIVVNNNKLTGGKSSAQGYGVYVVPNVTNYDLTVTKNTFTDIVKHAIAVQGNGDGSAVTAAKSITITDNNFISYGTRVSSDSSKDGAAFKIWEDTKYAPTSGAELTEAAKALVEAIQANNTFSATMKGDAQHYFLADIYGKMVAFN